jgi:hypothetical protein
MLELSTCLKSHNIHIGLLHLRWTVSYLPLEAACIGRRSRAKESTEYFIITGIVSVAGVSQEQYVGYVECH